MKKFCVLIGILLSFSLFAIAEENTTEQPVPTATPSYDANTVAPETISIDTDESYESTDSDDDSDN